MPLPVIRFLLFPFLPFPSGQPALDYVDASAGLQVLPLDGGGTEVELGDTNGDGHLDLVTIGDHGSPYVNTNEHGITTFFGDGAGGWTLFQNGDFGYGGIALGDVNGDGALDVGYAMHHNYSASDFGDQLIEVALGDGSGLAWTPWDDGLATNGETYGMFATDFADVDGDGRLDVAANSFGCCAGVHVYRNEGDGTWTQTFGFLGGNATPFATFGDVNGDGHPDLAVGNDTGNVWLGDGRGGFTLADGNLPGSAGTRRGLDLGDVDLDGRDELAFVLPGGEIQVWGLVDATSWVERSAGLPASSPYEIVQIADMDADGSPDLAVAGGGRFGVVLGDGTGTWTPALQREVASGADAEAFRVGGDFDHNGRPDLALVQDEPCGGFLCSRNVLHAFREASEPVALGAFLARPRGGEVWRAGSVRRVHWYAAVPAGATATADVELSLSGPGGPWIAFEEDGPNDGQAQLVVPRTLPTGRAFVRVVVRTAGASATATHPTPLRIVPPAGTPVRRAGGELLLPAGR